jgi:PBP1b-binding outer membrane lipoprotein LpoB
MNGKILLGSIITAFVFSGCLGFGEAKPKIKETKDKIGAKVKKVKDTEKKVKIITKTVDDSLPTPPESLLKDKVIETVVEIDDDNSDKTETKIIESVD